MSYDSHTVARTETIAAELAKQLRGGECIALHGDLGAGKTQFVRGLVKGLSGDPRSVSSPTFVLLNVYNTGRLIVHHLDAYRVHGPEDFEAIGFSELLEQGGVVAVEWPERVLSLLPKERIEVRITSTGDHSRRIEIERITPPGPKQTSR
jgi:tRNA threonylcarbamoyladenosine biosynthesis protein TsaE